MWIQPELYAAASTRPDLANWDGHRTNSTVPRRWTTAAARSHLTPAVASCRLYWASSAATAEAPACQGLSTLARSSGFYLFCFYKRPDLFLLSHKKSAVLSLSSVSPPLRHVEWSLLLKHEANKAFKKPWRTGFCGSSSSATDSQSVCERGKRANAQRGHPLTMKSR